MTAEALSKLLAGALGVEGVVVRELQLQPLDAQFLEGTSLPSDEQLLITATILTPRARKGDWRQVCASVVECVTCLSATFRNQHDASSRGRPKWSAGSTVIRVEAALISSPELPHAFAVVRSWDRGRSSKPYKLRLHPNPVARN